LTFSDDSQRTVRTLADLVRLGLVEATAAAALAPVVERYPMALTPEVVGAMEGQGPQGGVGCQFLPDAAELWESPEERPDPIGDERHRPLPGLVHRHPDRVLLMPTTATPRAW